MKPIKLKVNTKSQNYNIIIGNDLVSRVFNLAKNNSLNFKQCLLIIDKNISKKIISKIKKSLIKKRFMFTFLKQAKKIKIKIM